MFEWLPDIDPKRKPIDRPFSDNEDDSDEDEESLGFI